MKYSKEELVAYIYWVHGAGLDVDKMKNLYIFSDANQKMGFGKYKYETIGYVMEADRQYIEWMLRKTPHFITEELLNEYEWVLVNGWEQ